uniref:Small RNA 2'-O-methyltransferase n=1 Tax=Aceria tosichella TaxID=561515 RepID=A0A6G1SPA1_9ACAR
MPAIFNPPLSTQRYCWVQRYLEQSPHLTSLTDVGCGNGRMLLWTKVVPQIEKINCIDADAIMLECEMDHHFRPNLFEMIMGRRTSTSPVQINVFQGDIAVPDDRLQADCFTLIEMIEHITLEHLEKVSRTVFGYYKPKCVIVSTPNSEFNPLLRQHAEDSGESLGPFRPKDPNNPFRHWDHKFEWTRAEFISWAQTICTNFGYDFFIDGVGELPGSEPYGPCTQIAIFQLKPSCGSGVSIQSDLACFDLLINKLSVKEQKSEFLGDLEKKRICLMATFKVPGYSIDNPPPTHSDFDWSTLNLDESNSTQQEQQQCDQTMTNAD